jgi:hypothetical protein
VDCELCVPARVVAENAAAYGRAGTWPTSSNRTHQLIGAAHSPDGYNIGVNVGKAAGQSRMHVHVHLIPRRKGDVPDPSGGVRCVL